MWWFAPWPTLICPFSSQGIVTPHPLPSISTNQLHLLTLLYSSLIASSPSCQIVSLLMHIQPVSLPLHRRVLPHEAISPTFFSRRIFALFLRESFVPIFLPAFSQMSFFSSGFLPALFAQEFWFWFCLTFWSGPGGWMDDPWIWWLTL